MIERSAGLPTKWEVETDVVVCGSGGAALTGALVAAIDGAQVVVLEKADMVGGTTAMSGGGVWIPNNGHMHEHDIKDSREDALTYLRACVKDSGEEEMLAALVDEGPKAIRYIEEKGGPAIFFRAWPAVGGTSDYRPWLPGERPGARTLDPGWFELEELGDRVTQLRNRRLNRGDKLDLYRKHMHAAPPSGQVATTHAALLSASPPTATSGPITGGSALMGRLFKACLDKGVDVRVSSPVKRLLMDGGEIVGVEAEHNCKKLFVRARKGVLIGAGGYSKNKELLRNWMQRPLEYCCETEESTGDGHLMGMAVGAQTAHLGDAWFMPFIAAAGAEKQTGHSRGERCLPHTIIVNGKGRRFVNEPLNYNDFGDSWGIKQDGPRNLPAWIIFDSQGVEKYGVLATFAKDAEAGAAGFIGADTIEGLADKLKINPAGNLRATIERFNTFARKGEDPDFGRGQNPWDVRWGDARNKPNPSLGTLEKGPFYATEIRPSALATKGGLKINAKAEVLSAADGKPIPGLYAAGNCASSATPGAYPGPGATLGAAMTFGYIAGRELAKR